MRPDSYNSVCGTTSKCRLLQTVGKAPPTSGLLSIVAGRYRPDNNSEDNDVGELSAIPQPRGPAALGQMVVSQGRHAPLWGCNLSHNVRRHGSMSGFT